MSSAPDTTLEQWESSEYKYGFVTDIESDTVPPGLNEDVVRLISAKKEEPEWLTEMRMRYWKAFCERGYPTQKDEEWMRTDLRLFKPDRYAIPTGEAGQASSQTALLSKGIELAGSCVSFDGRPVESELLESYRSQGVIFGSLEEMIADHGDLIRKHLLCRAVDPQTDKFSLLNAACWSAGQFLYVPPGVVIEQPLHALSLMSDGGSDFGHTLVILGKGAEATLLAETASDQLTGGGLHCGAIELIVGTDAHLRYVNLQNWGTGVWHFAHQKGIVGRDASLQWTIGALGSRLAKVNQHVSLVGKGAQCQVNGVMFTEGKQHLSYHTLQHHVATNCRSDLLYKSALQGHSRIVWRGMIQVDKGAQQTDGYQRNDNLLLSGNARADSIPGLEIEADDVRCTHGSTTGRVDNELIFYAQCRGYSRKEATRMIVTGFFQKVFDRITIESVREALGQAIGDRVQDYTWKQ